MIPKICVLAPLNVVFVGGMGFVFPKSKDAATIPFSSRMAGHSELWTRRSSSYRTSAKRKSFSLNQGTLSFGSSLVLDGLTTTSKPFCEHFIGESVLFSTSIFNTQMSWSGRLVARYGWLYPTVLQIYKPLAMNLCRFFRTISRQCLCLCRKPL